MKRLAIFCLLAITLLLITSSASAQSLPFRPGENPRLDAELSRKFPVGMRVGVPFGSKTLPGVVTSIQRGKIYVKLDRIDREPIPYDPLQVSPEDTFDYTFYKSLKPGQEVSVNLGKGWTDAKVLKIEEARALIHFDKSPAKSSDWVGPEAIRPRGAVKPTTKPATTAPAAK